MTKRTVLITGATGLLGREVLEAFGLHRSEWDVKGTGHSRADGVDILRLDLGKEEEICKALDTVKFVVL